MIPFPDKQYNIIYADPPWQYNAWKGSKRNGNRNADANYQTMPLEDIKNLPVQDITADPCILFIWITNPLLEEGFQVIKAWGFKYKTIGFNWVKSNDPNSALNTFPYFMGMGYYTRPVTELCLLATKGAATKLVKDHFVPQLVQSMQRNHSRKPDKVRQQITKLVGDIPRIELFARQRAEGWDSWGLEVPEETQQLESFI